MERLTARDPVGNAYFPKCFEEPCGGGGCTKDHCEFLDSVCDKLAGYEEQGEQTEKLLAESEAARAELGKKLAAAQKMNAELTDAQAVMVKEFTAKLEELAQVKAERDAVLALIRGNCSYCKHWLNIGLNEDNLCLKCEHFAVRERIKGDFWEFCGPGEEKRNEKTDD